MALDRNIYWVGRQWAVTGLGIQAVDQRLQGAFDIEISRLWDDGLQERMRAYTWLNIDDFDKALATARARFPEPQRKSLPLIESVLELIQQPAPAEPAQPSAPVSDTSLDKAPPAEQPPRSPAQPLVLRVEHASARFMPQWRVRR